MSVLVGCYLTGIHPRSEETIELTKRYERGEATRHRVREALESDARRVIALQEELGFILVDDGQYQSDLFSTLIEHTAYIVKGPLTRWFDTNTFYESPVVRRQGIRFTGTSSDLLRTQWLPPSQVWKLNLPSPYTFAHLATLPKNYDRNEFMMDYARLLGGVARMLFENGDDGGSYVDMIQLSEPLLPYHIAHGAERGEITKAVQAVNEVVRAVRPQFEMRDVGLHTSFGDFTSLCPEIFECEADIFGIDLIATDHGSLPKNDFPDRDYALGLVDARHSLVETPEQIAREMEKVSEGLNGCVSIVPSCDLEHVTLPIAEQKMKNMAEAEKLMNGR